MRMYRDWSKTDPVQYFQEQYEGKIASRTRLSKKDPGLYNVLKKRSLLDQILPNQNDRNWNNTDPLEYFKQHHQGKVANKEELKWRDWALYVILRKRNLLDKILPDYQHHRDWTTTDPLKYFQQHYKGKIFNRSELSRKDQELCVVLRKLNLLDQILPNQNQNYRDWTTTDPITYFKQHYQGKITSRQELENKDSSLYQVLKHRKLFDKILPNQNQDHRDWSKTDPVKYFQEHYKGKIKRIVDLMRKDQSLCKILRTLGKLKLIFPKEDERKLLENLLRDYVNDDDDDLQGAGVKA